ncbi:hypothetical protein C8Q75DRAFT_869327, partial [Abortiporus biennis]
MTVEVTTESDVKPSSSILNSSSSNSPSDSDSDLKATVTSIIPAANLSSMSRSSSNKSSESIQEPTKVVNLHYDLINQIIDHLNTDTHTLETLSLVSKLFLSRTRYHLFNHTKINSAIPLHWPYDQVQKFEAFAWFLDEESSSCSTSNSNSSKGKVEEES